MDGDNGCFMAETPELDELRRRLAEALMENETLQQTVKRKERSNSLLTKLSENAERMRRAHEEEKKLQYLYNDLLLKNSPNAVILCDENLQLVLGSNSQEHLFAGNPTKFRGKPLGEIFSPSIDPLWVDDLVKQSAAVLKRRCGRRVNDFIALNENDSINVQIVISPIIDEAERDRGVIITIMDVTELVEAQWRAEEAARSKSDFLANMSHEIRTPMNAIVGIAEILLHDDGLQGDHRKYVNDIKLSADALLTIINDILDISKLEAGKMNLVPIDFDFKMLIENVSSLGTYIAQEKDLAFTLECAGDIPPILHADDVRLRQVLVNLIGNAVKFTDSGGVALSVRTDKREIRFDVADSGIGISPEDQKGLFAPFRQVAGAISRGRKGTGLGLSISQNIARLMGGRIELKSELGKGSVFSFIIPKTAGDRLPDKRNEEAKNKTVFADSVKILVVDDNEINLSVAVGLLKTLYKIPSEQAISGKRALELVREKQYDLIFMDHMMPDMDGVETTTRIRRLGGWREKVPIIALTANAVSGARKMLLDAGLNDFLAKPLQKDELDAILLRWIPARHRTTSSTPGEADAQPARTAEYSGVLGEIAKLPEISLESGLAVAAGQGEVYEQSLKLLADKIPNLSDSIEKLHRKRDISDLTIHVHGLKSSLASVGAGPMSRQAQELETASKSGDSQFIDQRLPQFLMELRRLGDKLRTAFASAPTPRDDRPQGNAQTLRKGLAQLGSALATYDFDAINSSLEPLVAHDFGPGVNPLLVMLREKIDSFDYAAASTFMAFHFPDFAGE